MTFDGRLLSGGSLLATVVEHGSFARAGETLGLSPSGVSRAIAQLEDRLGIRLLDRTTRALHLTDEGRQFYSAVMPHLEAIGAATDTASGAAEIVRGRLRVNADPFFSGLVLGPHLVELHRRYPQLSIEIHTRDDMGDLIADGIDIAIRFGPQPPSSMVARKILETRVITVAAPAYLTRHGQPAHPHDLARHHCIQFRNPQTGRPFDWEFRNGKTVLPVQTQGTLLLTDVNTMIEACLSGAGIAQILALGTTDLIQSGRLIDLFPDWAGETFPLYAVHPSRRNPAAKVRAFIDFCIETAHAGHAQAKD